jgi:transmembrane sensor
VRPDGVHVEIVGLDEIRRQSSWTDGRLSFNGQTLIEVTDEFNRYNRKHLVVADASIADRKIGGVFRSNEPESFASALQKFVGVHAEEQAPGSADTAVIRLSKAR